MPQMPIMPQTPWYKIFWIVTVLLAAINAVMEPFKMAFLDVYHNQFGTQYIGWTVAELIFTFYFVIDIFLKFFVAFEDPLNHKLVTDPRRIRINYLYGMFTWDCIVSFPFVLVILGANPSIYNSSQGQLLISEANGSAITIDHTNNVALYIYLLSLLKLGRLYSVGEFFSRLERSMILSLVAGTIIRNTFYILILSHTFACIFYFEARAGNFGSNTWIGARHLDRFEGQPIYNQYMYSLYTSTVCYAGLGDQDFYSANPTESLLITIYMIIVVFMSAYILGTVTLLMVKSDERSGAYREDVTLLREYAAINGLPDNLVDSMRKHVDLHHEIEWSSDHKVLALYPNALTRKVLRFMYLGALKEAYLFKDCRPKFLDAILSSCRVSVFTPKVSLIAEGDIVSDLYVIIEGKVEIMSGKVASRMGETDDTTEQKESSLSRRYSNGSHASDNESERSSGSLTSELSTPSKSKTETESNCSKRSLGSLGSTKFMQSFSIVEAGQRLFKGPGEVFGEIPFFSETPSLSATWTTTTLKVLIIPRSVYLSLQTGYEKEVYKVITNLRTRIENDLVIELQDSVDLNLQIGSPLATSLSPWIRENQLYETINIPDKFMKELITGLSSKKQERVKQLLAARTNIPPNIQAIFEKEDMDNMIQMLDAASNGNVSKVERMLARGVSSSCADYDKRTALMVAAQGGHDAVVRVLIENQCDIFAVDIFGTNALLGCIRRSHVACVDLLVAAGLTLHTCTGILMDEVVELLVSGDTAQLERYLAAGIDVNFAHGYNKCSLLHYAALEGFLQAVQIVVEKGADILLENRMGATALDEARRVKALGVIDFLEPLMAAKVDERQRRKAEEAVQKGQTGRRVSIGSANAGAPDMWGSVAAVDDPEATRQAAKMLAASAAGDEVTVRKLLDMGVSPSSMDYDRRTALMVSASEGKDSIVKLLLKAKADFEVLDVFGTNALVGALRGGHTGSTKLLLNAGCSLVACPKVTLTDCIESIHDGSPDLMQRYLHAGADPNLADNNSCTLLHISIMEKNLEAIKILTASGCNLYAKDRWGMIPLETARYLKLNPIVQYLEPLYGGASSGEMPTPFVFTIKCPAAAPSSLSPRLANRGLPTLINPTGDDIQVAVGSEGMGVNPLFNDIKLPADVDEEGGDDDRVLLLNAIRSPSRSMSMSRTGSILVGSENGEGLAGRPASILRSASKRASQPPLPDPIPRSLSSVRKHQSLQVDQAVPAVSFQDLNTGTPFSPKATSVPGSPLRQSP